jgi:hypothetical protein
MIPDFLFEKADMKVYMEVAGFWTPEYLRHKLEQLRGVEDVDMIVAADRGHACQQLDRLGKRLDIVYYKRKVPLRPILGHLKAREESLKTTQLEQLRGMELRIEGRIVSSAELAKRLGFMEEAVLEALRQRDVPGYRLFGDVLISELTLAEIERRLEDRIGEGSLSLRKTTELIEEHGGARPSRILEHLGYTIEWRGISPETATVQREK